MRFLLSIMVMLLSCGFIILSPTGFSTSSVIFIADSDTEAGNKVNQDLALLGDFTNGAWRPEGLIATIQPGTAPDGKSLTFKLSEAETAGRHRTEVTIPGTFKGLVTIFSLYVKPVDRRNIEFEIRDNQGGRYGVVRFDLNRGTVDTKNGDITSAGVEGLPDGWFRCWASMLFASDIVVFSPALMNDRGEREYQGKLGTALMVGGLAVEHDLKSGALAQ